MKLIHGKTLEEWKRDNPNLHTIMETEETFWQNPKYKNFEKAESKLSITLDDVKEAEERLIRFAPYLIKAFPETKETNGMIDSRTIRIPKMKKAMENHYKMHVNQEVFLKTDNFLPISGSIKARGGIYEVLKFAERIAIDKGMLSYDDDYSILTNKSFRELFSHYSIAVGSTGNLGLSIGIISAKLGFNVYVHMSADAKKWKKDLLKEKGVTVIEYNSDYSKAVTEGRRQAQANENMHFIDDENSKDLFLGYAVAALRLQKQLEELGIVVNEENPLFVYLPCGVGGGPGGVAFGLKLIFKDSVHCFFAEPTHSPAMLLGLLTGLHEKVSVQDFDIDNVTEADGLAVGRPSGFVGKLLEELISGVYTVEDEHLFQLLTMLVDTENINLEPSALAGFPGVIHIINHPEFQYPHATHLVWATGGSMLPEEMKKENYEKGKSYMKK
ncbi:D-serine ammonia-lyase [Metabacillus sp. B2-18]|uniref:D-serine ammonia-lyase n=1 Tax=Metabacillus sp. B2-18 TaxID=2897333 RepID=UPI001E2DA470|nr:D-serine ammonia-lyase [Metabacillus sp. B2-18]UGB28907.1 D-serine ammonia-lyase [Metabacillus sp. B2-18]